jgi:hypothetical protein
VRFPSCLEFQVPHTGFKGIVAHSTPSGQRVRTCSRRFTRTVLQGKAHEASQLNLFGLLEPGASSFTHCTFEHRAQNKAS